MRRARFGSALFFSLIAVAPFTVGCGGDDTRQLDPQSFAMSNNTQPFFDNGEVKLFEVQVPVQLPIKPPDATQKDSLKTPAKPFPRTPWVTKDDVKVQMTFTLTNLDTDSHNVAVVVDPWNEFGRYVPGVSGTGENAQPNLSGIQQLYIVPGKNDPSSKGRIEHTFSYDDMDELATDFATAYNIIKTVPAHATADSMDDQRVGLVNHAFDVLNRSGSDVYTDRYRPGVIPALLGFDVGLLSQEGDKAPNVAMEFTLEIVDKQGNRVIPEDDGTAPDVAPKTVITLGAAAAG
jgi:hypothetical protein